MKKGEKKRSHGEARLIPPRISIPLRASAANAVNRVLLVPRSYGTGTMPLGGPPGILPHGPAPRTARALCDPPALADDEVAPWVTSVSIASPDVMARTLPAAPAPAPRTASPCRVGSGLGGSRQRGASSRTDCLGRVRWSSNRFRRRSGGQFAEDAGAPEARRWFSGWRRVFNHSAICL